MTSKPRGAMARYYTPEFARVAMQGLLLRCEVGSGVHGIAVEGTDDRDEMGICAEPPEYVTGLRQFEQYMYRSAWTREPDAPDPEHVRSQPGDLDFVAYSLRKWMRMALRGNPSVLLPLFAPDDAFVTLHTMGESLIFHADKIVSRQAGYRFLGYLHDQRERLLGLKSSDVHRPELIEAYGYDTKFASHALRLGMQGIELMMTGRLSLPMQETDRLAVLRVKQGKYKLEDALDLIAHTAAELEKSVQLTELRPAPDQEWADHFLTSVYTSMWGYEKK
jgi:uncharacterized protein